MSFSYAIRRSADKDLDEIADYLGRHSFNAGVRFLEAVKLQLLFLGEYPGAGALCRSVPRALRGLRSCPIRGFRKYLIFYLRVEGGIDVVRVIHGARNIRRALRETDS